METRTVMLVAVPVVALGLAGGGFYFGYAQRGPEVEAAEARAEEATSAQAAAAEAARQAEASLQRRLTEAQDRLPARDQRIALLEARRQLALTIGQIERRNFGTAGDHLSAAGDRLGEAGDAPEVTTLAADVAGYELSVTNDLGPAREAVGVFATRIDMMLTALGPLPSAAAEAPPEIGEAPSEDETEAPSEDEPEDDGEAG